MRSEGKVINKAAYIIMGISMSGNKEILGIWVRENESANHWLRVLTELKNRGERCLYCSYRLVNRFERCYKSNLS